jgi:hypothetical protein
VLRVGERCEVEIELRKQRLWRDAEFREHRRHRHDRTDANVAGRDGLAKQWPGIELSWHGRLSVRHADASWLARIVNVMAPSVKLSTSAGGRIDP